MAKKRPRRVPPTFTDHLGLKRLIERRPTTVEERSALRRGVYELSVRRWHEIWYGDDGRR